MAAQQLVWLAVLVLGTSAAGNGKLDLVYKWKSVEFEYPSSQARDAALLDKSFIPGNTVPLDVDFWENRGEQKMFVTIPRFQAGIPASLATVTDLKGPDGSHLLRPYPHDWTLHREGNCEGITSVFRTQIDKCGRLWAIDSGVLFTTPKYRTCQPQLLAFTISTDKLAGLYRFPEKVLWARSVLATIAVDVRDAHENCWDTFVYVADVTGFALIVFDVKRTHSWKVVSASMYPYPPQGVFRPNGVEFDLMDGILGLALAPSGKYGERILYYHPFASLREAWVPTSVLRNETLHPAGAITSVPRKFKVSEEARPSQTAPMVFDRNGNQYFVPVNENSLMCWSSAHPYTANHLHQLVHDDNNLQFVTGIKVREDAYGNEELYVLSDRFHLVMVGQMNPKQVNIRILKGRISELTRGSPCKHSSSPSTSTPSNGGFVFPKRPSSGYGSFGG